MPYYKRTVLLNKANLAWVCSEGTRGHEIQSLTLAKALSRQQQISHIKLTAPWDWLLPRLLPGISAVLKPQLLSDASSDLVISTGRRMAGAARWLRKNHSSQAKYVQILNPGYYFKDFDVVLLPEHDQVKHPKVIPFRGNLHPFNRAWFKSQQQTDSTGQTIIVLFIGSPSDDYFKQQFLTDLNHIRVIFKTAQIQLCGSPRLTSSIQTYIRSLIHADEQLWLNHSDGENPYTFLLANADKIFVTADSINMMNEAGASEVSVSLLAKDHIKSRKHQRFITSLAHRLSPLDIMEKTPALADPLQQLLTESDLLQRLDLL